MKYFLLAVVASTMVVTCYSQNSVCFTIEANPNPNDPALAAFAKYVDVYGCGIYAENSVSDGKVLHVAAVFAELLDNDEDGVVDDVNLHEELLDNQALMPVFASDGSPAMDAFEDNYSGTGIGAVLWKNEIDPSQTGHWGADATVEEILHTINSVGHVNMFPDAFGLNPNSSLLSAAMDVARAGQFTDVPTEYPEEAWYHYDDVTCDYQCMAIEYLYWAIVSYMGILDDPETCDGIADEWELCSHDLLMNTDELIYALITDPQYKLPLSAPDGNYCPPTFIDSLNNYENWNVYPNPTEADVFITTDESYKGTAKVYDSRGKVVHKQKFRGNAEQLNLQHLEGGLYTIEIDTVKLRVMKQ